MRTAKHLVVWLGMLLALPWAAHAANSWESTIQYYETQDLAYPPPSGSIVVTGSSSIVRWTTMASDLYPLDLIPRGFGGSVTSDLDYFLDRIVLKYNPRAVVIYEGDNDLVAGVTPQAASATMAGILARISARLPDTRVYIISVKMGPGRLYMSSQIRQLNQLNAALCAADARYTYIDVFNALTYSDGTPIAAYYDTDGVHLSSAGYGMWGYVIRNVLRPQQVRPMPTDATPPTTPTGVAATAVGTTQVNVQWSAASDAGSGLAGYRIYRDGQAIATTTTTTYADRSVAANSYYSYALSAYDRALPSANESLRTAAAFVTTPPPLSLPPVPTVAVTATPAAILTGGTSTITWVSANATSCTASGAWSGSRALFGSLAVTPGATAVFSLTCAGPGGSGNALATVTVSTPPPVAPPPAAPTVTLSAAAAAITRGDSVVLSWTSANATTCTRAGTWAGNAATAGSSTVTPAATSDYAITCTGAGGSISATTRVSVAPPPTVSLSASAASVQAGSAVSLQWSSANAASCTASGGWSGARSVSGNEMSPALSGNAEYKLTCSGPYGGSAVATIEVTVTAAPPATTTPAVPATTTTPAAETGATSGATGASSSSSSSGGGGGGFDYGALLALLALMNRTHIRRIARIAVMAAANCRCSILSGGDLRG